MSEFPRTRYEPAGKPEVNYWGSTIANSKLKGIDGRAPPGVEPAA